MKFMEMRAVNKRKEAKRMKTRSPLIWFGGKQRLAKHIINLMPDHSCYCEPFGGGAGVIAAKQPVKCDVYNDIDGEVVNFLMILRADPDKLTDAVSTLPFSRRLYEEWKWSEPPTDGFERAVRWFYINRSGIAAGNNHKSGWRHSWSVNPARGYRNACDLLSSFARRMQNVMIECQDFREIIKIYDSPQTLFYIDPPYRGNEYRYKGGFTDQDHENLANLLETIQGKAIVSYYHDDWIDSLYYGWNKKTIDTYVYSQPSKTAKTKATEIFYMNYSLQPSLFDWEAMHHEPASGI